MRLMSIKQYEKMTKASLVRKIMKALKKLPKMKLAKICYELQKKQLPSISTTRMPRLSAKKRAYTVTAVRGKRKSKRSPAQLRNDKRLGRMAKARAKVKRRRRRR